MKTWEKFLFYGMLWAIYARTVDHGVESVMAHLFSIACACGVLFTVFRGDE